jgi:hypothetical protein
LAFEIAGDVLTVTNGLELHLSTSLLPLRAEKNKAPALARADVNSIYAKQLIPATATIGEGIIGK